MRIIGIIAAYNEEPVIAACLEHHIAQGIELYLMDNDSTDRTVEIARQFVGRGLIGIEQAPRHGRFELNTLLARKAALARALDADWFIHLDADEMRLAPGPDQTLAQAIAVADAAGYNAINFLEFTFVPTIESPDHRHSRFHETMRWYYPFLPRLLHRVNGWKRQPQPVNLVSEAGHVVMFPGQFIHPLPFLMRHYQFLSVEHAIQKYSWRRHPSNALAQGRHGWRDQLDPESICLPSQTELHEILNGGYLDSSHPRSRHVLDRRGASQDTEKSLKRSMVRRLLRVPHRGTACALIMGAARCLRAGLRGSAR